jgi:D-serine deaminase-like pyridoxal phosphate-dependent protein
VSRRGTAAVLNAGLKALAVDHGLPRPMTQGPRTLGLSDEHARVAVADGMKLAIGDVILVAPSHLDPTVNLHDVLFVGDADSNEVERWPVDARRVLAGQPW